MLPMLLTPYQEVRDEPILYTAKTYLRSQLLAFVVISSGTKHQCPHFFFHDYLFTICTYNLYFGQSTSL